MDANTYYLNEYMSKLTQNDGIVLAKLDWIEERAKELLKGECNPFNPGNIQEAISELSLADSCLLGAYVEGADNSNDSINSAIPYIYLGDFLIQITTKYWSKVAFHMAEREYDERIY